MKKLLLLTFSVVLLTSCSSRKKMVATGFTQGTTYSISYYSDGADYQYQIDSLLLSFDRVLSTYQDNSYITKWNENKADALETPPMFKEVVGRSLEITQMTGGAFDITVKPIFSFWFENNWKLADLDSSLVDSMMTYVGSHHLKWENGKLVKDDPRVKLDVNAIAQGYSVDVVGRFFESKGVFDYLIEIGGEVKAQGQKDDGSTWNVGIERPDIGENAERVIQMSIPLENAALATSGNYRKFLEVKGQKLGHALDPRIGYPAKTDVLSATIITNDCMTADALATACMVLKFEGAKKLIESHEEIEGILIYGHGAEMKTWVSEGVKSKI